MAFIHTFEGRHPSAQERTPSVCDMQLPPIEAGVAAAIRVVTSIEQVAELPRGNRNLVAKMTEFMVKQANMLGGSPFRYDTDEWGLYLVGSRGEGTARSSSDVDLMSVGSFSDLLGFGAVMRPNGRPVDDAQGLLEGFRQVDDKNDDNFGYIRGFERFPRFPIHLWPEHPGDLRVDLTVVDLEGGWRYEHRSLAEFKDDDQFDNRGEPRSLLPLVEVRVPHGHGLGETNW